MKKLAVEGACFIALFVAGCGAPQGGTNHDPGADDSSGSDASSPDDPDGTEVTAESPDPPACQAFVSDSADPLMRWLDAFPLERGGVVLSFTSESPDQMEVEAVLEMRGIAGYEAVTCPGAGSVVVWILGLECEEQTDGVIGAVERGSAMRHHGTDCFRLDEVRPRMSEECSRGTISAERCGGH